MNVDVFFLFQMVEISSNIDILVSEGKFCRTGQLVSGLISKHCVYFSMVVGRRKQNKLRTAFDLNIMWSYHVISVPFGPLQKNLR